MYIVQYCLLTYRKVQYIPLAPPAENEYCSRKVNQRLVTLQCISKLTYYIGNDVDAN